MTNNDNDILTKKVDDKEVYFAYKNGKIGVIHTLNANYNIPIKYDEIQYDESYDINDFNTDVLAYVRQGDKWGAYCYIIDFHDRYDKKRNRCWEQEYIKKRFIPPLFDSVQLIKNNTETYYLKVSINGKYGILNVYNNKFVTPVVFDSIDKTIITYMNFEIFGKINGKDIRYDGKHFQELTPYYFNYNEAYKLIKQKIEKEGK